MYWDESRGKIQSSKGGWRIGEGVFLHGHSLLEELVGHKSYFQILVLNATGKLPDARFSNWLEAVYGCLSWPDPRIWCNQIGALGGTTRVSAVAATTAGILASDSRSYGIKPLKEGVETIQRLFISYMQTGDVQQVVNDEVQRLGGKPHIMGYARPIAKGDERINTMERVAKDLKYDVGKHLAFAYEVEKCLVSEFDEYMNINGYMSAFMADEGFTAEETYRIFATLVMSGITACYADARDKPTNAFLPLRCEDIIYDGKPVRQVPDAD